jgi:hypothetical protein
MLQMLELEWLPAKHGVGGGGCRRLWQAFAGGGKIWWRVLDYYLAWPI